MPSLHQGSMCSRIPCKILHAQGSISGARILRLNKVTNFSVHDMVLVDAPAFHFSLDTCTNGEVYNMAIRGGNEGGLDGIDVWSDNIWIHDVGLSLYETANAADRSRSWSPTRTNA